MKKNTVFVFLPVVCAILFFVVTGCRSCVGGPHDSVSREFIWIENLNLGLGEPILEERDWFKMYNINTNQMERLIMNDLSKYGYRGWEDYRESMDIGPSTDYTVNGKKDQIKINYLTGSDRFDKVAVIVDVSTMKLILFYGRTYGM
jgi:hypothetical protein